MHSAGVTAVPLLTQVVVDQYSEAFKDPTKFVGPIYGSVEANALSQSLGWKVKPDGEYFRRVVPSPLPLEILQIDAIKTLLEECPSVLPIACGGGSVPFGCGPLPVGGVLLNIIQDQILEYNILEENILKWERT